jgi:hypothetical protein
VQYSKAVQLLRSMLATSEEPTLTDEQVDLLLSISERVDVYGNSPANVSDVAVYASAVAYVPGDLVRSGDRFWLASTPGTSGGVTFPDLRGLPAAEYVAEDNGIRWVDNGSLWARTYDLNAAAAVGWRWKAGLVAHKYAFGTDGQTFTRNQWFAHCMQMAEVYGKRAPLTVTLVDN